MDDYRHLLHPQFSLRLLMTMTATCAVAFAVLGQDFAPLLRIIAGSVPAFWLGWGMRIVGEALVDREKPWREFPGLLLAAWGAVLSLASILFAVVLAVLWIVDPS
jgi:hypothetical protein